MSMVKSIVPKEQSFSELASGQFFTIGPDNTKIYQKILEVDGPNRGPLNTVELGEYSVGQRGTRYEFRLIYVTEKTVVSHVEVADIDIFICPKSV
jgi:hypothetical protein